jgi:transcriptional regulator with XRE-family HTH domain
MPARLWKPNPTKLRELREAQSLSQRDLADKADVNAETIVDIESGKRRGVRLATLKKLALPLFVEWDELLSKQERARRERGQHRLAVELMPESSLDLLSFAEAEKPEPKLETRFGSLEAFGAVEMVDTIAAPRIREGDRYYVFGEISRQRPVTALDEAILDLPPLECARFEILRRLDPDLEPFAATIITCSKEQTRRLQERWRTGKLVYAIVRVLVACPMVDDRDHLTVTNLDGGAPHQRPRAVGGRSWEGFEMIASQSRFAEEKASPTRRPQLWALMVEEVLEGSVDRHAPLPRSIREYPARARPPKNK